MTINRLIENIYLLLTDVFLWLLRGFEALFNPLNELSFAERMGELTVGQFTFTLAVGIFLLWEGYRIIAKEADGFLPRWVTLILTILSLALPLWFFWTRIFAYQGGA